MSCPRAGDEVHVHYTARLENGETLESSRNRPGHYRFTLGSGKALKALDLAVATMMKAETAIFTLGPEFAYDDFGVPPKIAAKTTVKFEVELLFWKIRENLTVGGGVSKIVYKPGKCGRCPKDTSICLVWYTAHASGEVLRRWNCNIGVVRAAVWPYF